jgi:hypothetical protein
MPKAGRSRHEVTLKAASEFTRAYRKSRDRSQILGGRFSRDIFERILGQRGCEAIRYYYGKDRHGEPVLVLVGTDAKGDDLWEGVIGEVAYPCPPYCPAPNPLNT